jgi:protein ImuA
MIGPAASSSRDDARAARLAVLRGEIAAIETGARPSGAVLPFGIAAIDAALPGGGVATGALHEATGAAPTLADEACATVFLAGIAARLTGPVLWCRRAADLFAPGLAQAGLHPDRVLHVELGSDADVLAAMEEGLRVAHLAAVVGEVRRLGLTASRRLQLAAEANGVTALVQRRLRQGERVDEPGAAVTRWRVGAAPSTPIPLPIGLGRPRWHLRLDRVRGGDIKDWLVEACDAEGCLALVPDIADGSAAYAVAGG